MRSTGPGGSSSRGRLGHRVVAAAAEGIARQDPFEREETANHDAAPLDRFDGVLGTGGRVAAGRRQLRADGGLVEAQGTQDQAFHAVASRSTADASATSAPNSSVAPPARAVTRRSSPSSPVITVRSSIARRNAS